MIIQNFEAEFEKQNSFSPSRHSAKSTFSNKITHNFEAEFKTQNYFSPNRLFQIFNGAKNPLISATKISRIFLRNQLQEKV